MPSPTGHDDSAAAASPIAAAPKPTSALAEGAPEPATDDSPGPAEGFAVVELFTSQGCSSCPPADDLLRELTAEARAAGKAVYLLSFHVDYWNDLGWRDPFSAAAFSERQRAYARRTGASGVYTPQMIIGGRDAFVGSDASHARRSLAQALAATATATISLKARAPDGAGHIDVTYAATGSGVTEDTWLHVALVERDLSVRVTRGENAGRTLRHENVVRAFESARAGSSPEGTIKLPLPPSIDKTKTSVIGYAQRGSSFSIVGAASAPIE